ELWDVFAQRSCIYGVKNVHIRILLSFLLSTRFGGADCVLCHSHAQNRKSAFGEQGLLRNVSVERLKEVSSRGNGEIESMPGPGGHNRPRLSGY
ncbi:MAG: hypothetical protein RL252_220, partial [Actinomycetota bacterium]